MDDNWEDIEVPQGTFIGWGEIGQTITLEVVSYGDTAGTDFNGNTCPQLVGTLIMDAINYRKGEREKIAKGAFVTIQGSQASLRSAMRSADLRPGYLARIKFEGTYKTTKGTDGKAFKISVNRATRGVAVDELI
jgi:hypothetical protein